MAMRIDIETQRRVYREHAGAAAERLLDLLRERMAELVELGFERAFDTVGVHEYGDSTYWKSGDQLLDETLAELADGIFYAQVIVAREAGSLPSP